MIAKMIPLSWVTINVDGTMFSDSGQMGWGWICRTDQDQVIEARNGVISSLIGPEYAEAETILQALKWVRDLHHTRVKIRSDAQFVVRLIQDTASLASSLG